VYTSFYGLNESPFGLTPDPKYLYLTDAHKDGVASMLYGVRARKGFVVILGEVGTGKTTLIRYVLGQLGPEVRTAYMFRTPQTFDELLDAVLRDLDVACPAPDRLSRLDTLTQFLLAEAREGRDVALVVDEAQKLTPGLLEELRVLSNLETAEGKLLQVVLAGQPELAVKLADPNLRQLHDRIAHVAVLKPLTRRQTAAYVEHRLALAGASRTTVFTRRALSVIHRVSHGIPRRVNVVCDKALVLGYAARAQRIPARIVEQVEREWRALPRRPAPRRWPAVAAVLCLLVAGGAALSVEFLPSRRNAIAAREAPSTVATEPSVTAAPPVAAVQMAVNPTAEKPAAANQADTLQSLRDASTPAQPSERQARGVAARSQLPAVHRARADQPRVVSATRPAAEGADAPEPADAVEWLLSKRGETFPSVLVDGEARR
jgi:general secretion pathway protein A